MMPPKVFRCASLLCCMIGVLTFAAGCDTQGNQCPGGQCPSAQCPGDHCYAPCCAPCACPDNPFDGPRYPEWRRRPTGSVGSDETPIEVNVDARSEPKGGGGATCPQAGSPQRVTDGAVVWVGPWRPVGTGQAATPASEVCPTCPQTKPAATKPSVAGEEKEGLFRCQNCQRATVGREWHEVWGDDGTPLTMLCEKCWGSLQPADRMRHLEDYVAKSKLSAVQKLYARAAYR